jgi:hypothetical protein
MYVAELQMLQWADQSKFESKLIEATVCALEGLLAPGWQL